MTKLTRREMLLRTGAGLAGATMLGPLADTWGDAAHAESLNAPAPTGTITCWQHEGSAVFDTAYNAMVTAFEQKYPGVKVQTLKIPYANFETKALTAFTGGQPPDVIKIGGWLFPEYASKQLLAPLNPKLMGYSSLSHLEAAFAPGSLGSLSYKGKAYGVPIDFNSLIFMYRRDHFQQAGLNPSRPPQTWEDVLTVGKKLTKRSGGKLTRAGFQFWYGLPIWDMLDFQTLPAQLGGGVLNKSGTKGALSSAAGIKALQWYRDVSVVHKIGDPKFTDPNFNYGQIAAGTASMTVTGNFAVNLVETLGQKPKLGKQFDIAPYPQFAHATRRLASGYSWGWGVANKASNPTAAWLFLAFLMEQKYSNAFMKTGLIAPVKNWQHLSAVKGAKGAQLVAKETSYTDYGPRTPAWNEVAKALSDTLQAVALGQQSAQQAASGFDSQVAGMLAP
jgi:multiple sugar transport system substrate-binding protein